MASHLLITKVMIGVGCQSVPSSNENDLTLVKFYGHTKNHINKPYVT